MLPDIEVVGQTPNPAVSAVMTKQVVTIDRDQSIGAALDLMRRRHIRHLCVMDGARLSGVLSERDVNGALPSPMGDQKLFEQALESIPVASVMRCNAITVEAGQALAAAVRVMIHHQVGCLPVLERGRLVGIVTRSDLLRLLARMLD